MRAAYADREDPDGAYTARWGRPGDERDAALAAHAEVLVLARGQTPRDRGSPPGPIEQQRAYGSGPTSANRPLSRSRITRAPGDGVPARVRVAARSVRLHGLRGALHLSLIHI